MTTRREFLSAVMISPQIFRLTPQQPVVLDKIEEHILNEAKRIYKELEAGNWNEVNAFERNLHLHAIYSKMTGVDLVVSNTIRNEDRETLIYKVMDKTLFSYQTCSQSVDNLVSNGLSSIVENMAMNIEKVKLSIPSITGLDALVPGNSAACQGMRAACEIMTAAAAVICALTIVQPAIATACAIIAIEAAALCLIAWMWGC